MKVKVRDKKDYSKYYFYFTERWSPQPTSAPKMKQTKDLRWPQGSSRRSGPSQSTRIFSPRPRPLQRARAAQPTPPPGTCRCPGTRSSASPRHSQTISIPLGVSESFQLTLTVPDRCQEKLQGYIKLSSLHFFVKFLRMIEFKRIFPCVNNPMTLLK